MNTPFRVSLIATLLAVGSFAYANSPGARPNCGSDEVRRAAAEAHMRTVQGIYANYVNEPQSLEETTCLDSLFNQFKIAGSSFNLDTAAMLEGLKSKACGIVKTQIDQNLAKLNTGASLPYGLGGFTFNVNSRGVVSDISMNPSISIPGVGRVPGASTTRRSGTYSRDEAKTIITNGVGNFYQK